MRCAHRHAHICTREWKNVSAFLLPAAQTSIDDLMSTLKTVHVLREPRTCVVSVRRFAPTTSSAASFNTDTDFWCWLYDRKCCGGSYDNITFPWCKHETFTRSNYNAICILAYSRERLCFLYNITEKRKNFISCILICCLFFFIGYWKHTAHRLVRKNSTSVYFEKAVLIELGIVRLDFFDSLFQIKPPF